MKKAVITLLVLLPLLLVVVIAVTGRIYGTQEYIEVTEVYFVDEDGDKLDNVTIEVGEDLQLEYVLAPILATNKNVTFSSSNNNICLISQSGVLSGIGIGFADVKIKAINGVESSLSVEVVSSGATSITISHSSLVAYVGCYSTISAFAEPSTETANITWFSTNEDVVEIVNVSGGEGGKGGEVKLQFLTTGQATIMAKTDNGLTDECVVTVIDDGARFKENIVQVTETEVNLLDYIEGAGENVKFEIISGNGVIDDNTLTYKSSSRGVVKVKLVNNDSALNYDETQFVFMIN